VQKLPTVGKLHVHVALSEHEFMDWQGIASIRLLRWVLRPQPDCESNRPLLLDNSLVSYCAIQFFLCQES
jgi:hypothetical protein